MCPCFHKYSLACLDVGESRQTAARDLKMISPARYHMLGARKPSLFDVSMILCRSSAGIHNSTCNIGNLKILATNLEYLEVADYEDEYMEHTGYWRRLPRTPLLLCPMR
jgi:hypothetical protein